MRDATAFNQRLERVRAELTEQANALAAFALECHRRSHEIDKRLNGRGIDLRAVTVLNDIKQQLNELLQPRYLWDTPDTWLGQYPRYLQAMEIRLEKYPRDLRQQTLDSETLQTLRQKYEALLEQARARDALADELREFRWWLEEYRVSLFAQQLGTRFSVSEKRLRKRLDELA